MRFAASVIASDTLAEGSGFEGQVPAFRTHPTDFVLNGSEKLSPMLQVSGCAKVGTGGC